MQTLQIRMRASLCRTLGWRTLLTDATKLDQKALKTIKCFTHWVSHSSFSSCRRYEAVETSFPMKGSVISVKNEVCRTCDSVYRHRSDHNKNVHSLRFCDTVDDTPAFQWRTSIKWCSQARITDKSTRCVKLGFALQTKHVFFLLTDTFGGDWKFFQKRFYAPIWYFFPILSSQRLTLCINWINNPIIISFVCYFCVCWITLWDGVMWQKEMVSVRIHTFASKNSLK